MLLHKTTLRNPSSTFKALMCALGGRRRMFEYGVHCLGSRRVVTSTSTASLERWKHRPGFVPRAAADCQHLRLPPHLPSPEAKTRNLCVLAPQGARDIGLGARTSSLLRSSAWRVERSLPGSPCTCPPVCSASQRGMELARKGKPRAWLASSGIVHLAATCSPEWKETSTAGESSKWRFTYTGEAWKRVACTDRDVKSLQRDLRALASEPVATTGVSLGEERTAYVVDTPTLSAAVNCDRTDCACLFKY